MDGLLGKTLLFLCDFLHSVEKEYSDPSNRGFGLV